MNVQLPFSTEDFFDLFAAYNGALWPAVVALWVAAVLSGVWMLSTCWKSFAKARS